MERQREGRADRERVLCRQPEGVASVRLRPVVVVGVVEGGVRVAVGGEQRSVIVDSRLDVELETIASRGSGVGGRANAGRGDRLRLEI